MKGRKTAGARSTDNLPRVDCVVIGVNAAGTVQACLESIWQSHYPRELLTVTYVDGGSRDESLSLAGSVAGVKVIGLNLVHPTPGLGRNTGWKFGSAPLVLFLDADTLLDADWLLTGVKALEPEVAAVMGYRRERYPERSVFNWIGNLEWNGKPGDAECFGGDVLIRRLVLEETGGYDEELVGGEDPELSRRVRLRGWRIVQLDATMTFHDLAMTRVAQYWRRAYRSGYGFAAVADRYSHTSSSFWRKELRRIVVRGGGSLGCFFLSLVLLFFNPFSLYMQSAAAGLFLIGILLLFFPRLFRVKYFKKDKNISYPQAKTYAWHCSLVVIPDILGVARYYWGKLLHCPLRNRVNRIA